MDNQFRAFVALYYAIDRLYEAEPSDTTALCASELDPFLFKALGSADPAHYAKFCDTYTKRFGESVSEVAPNESYSLAKEFIAHLSAVFHAMYPDDATISDLFAKHINYGTWLELWEIASDVVSNRLTDLADVQA